MSDSSFRTLTPVRPNGIAVVAAIGPRGTSLLIGTHAPDDALGYDGDLYFDNVGLAIYGPKASGAWPDDGFVLQGLRGVPGPQILSGGGAPTAAIGTNGDYFLDSLNSILYGPKNTGAWPTTGISLIGGPGPASTLTIDTVTTLPPGSQATAQLTGASPNQKLSLGLPSGARGAAGAGAGDVTGPNGAGAGNLPVFADDTGKTLVDSGLNPAALLAAIPTRGQIVGLVGLIDSS